MNIMRNTKCFQPPGAKNLLLIFICERNERQKKFKIKKNVFISTHFKGVGL